MSYLWLAAGKFHQAWNLLRLLGAGQIRFGSHACAQHAGKHQGAAQAARAANIYWKWTACEIAVKTLHCGKAAERPEGSCWDETSQMLLWKRALCCRKAAGSFVECALSVTQTEENPLCLLPALQQDSADKLSASLGVFTIGLSHASQQCQIGELIALLTALQKATLPGVYSLPVWPGSWILLYL